MSMKHGVFLTIDEMAALSRAATLTRARDLENGANPDHPANTALAAAQAELDDTLARALRVEGR